MGFLVKGKDESVHILNPISPAFTSSMELARVVWIDTWSTAEALRPSPRSGSIGGSR